MAKIIQTSFKESENKLYMEVIKHSDKSSFIKDCIIYYLESLVNLNTENIPEKNNHFSQPVEVADILRNL